METRASSAAVSRPYFDTMAARREALVRGGRPATPSAPRVCASWAMAGWDFQA